MNNYETYFDSEYLFEAVKFANEVMDDDAIPDGLLGGGGGNEIVTIQDIYADFDFTRNLRVIGGLLFIPAIFMSFLLIPELRWLDESTELFVDEDSD